MCRDDKGIAAVYDRFSGRIRNVRLNDENEIIADFFERRANSPSCVLVSELKFPNKKAQKAFAEIKAALNKKRAKSTEVIMG